MEETLFDTIEDMISIDPRIRMKAERDQALIRLAELDWILERGVDIDNDYDLVERHRDALLDYIDVLTECLDARKIRRGLIR